MDIPQTSIRGVDALMIETRNLKDVLVEMMMLTEKYGFNPEDKRFMMEKCILLGEATSFLIDLGLLEEYKERYKKACIEIHLRGKMV